MEVTAAQGLLDTYLGAELDALGDFAAGKKELSKEQLRTRLVIVNNVMLGSGSLLPFWRREEEEEEDFERVVLAETLVEMHDALTSCVKHDGVLILSGIEARCLPLVDEAFIGSHWRVKQELPAGEWVTLTLSRISS